MNSIFRTRDLFPSSLEMAGGTYTCGPVRYNYYFSLVHKRLSIKNLKNHAVIREVV